MSRRLDDLDPAFQPQAIEFLARLTEAGLQVILLDTWRTQAEQDAALASGHSWTTHSKHLDGLALDVCLWREYRLHGLKKLQWDASDPAWEKLATIAERLGLRSGYRWNLRDCGHVELPGV